MPTPNVFRRPNHPTQKVQNSRLVLSGTILRVGDRVRVSAQLVGVPHGTLLWTTTAEAVLEDLFDVSDGLVRRIVSFRQGCAVIESLESLIGAVRSRAKARWCGRRDPGEPKQ